MLNKICLIISLNSQENKKLVLLLLGMPKRALGGDNYNLIICVHIASKL